MAAHSRRRWRSRPADRAQSSIHGWNYGEGEAVDRSDESCSIEPSDIRLWAVTTVGAPWPDVGEAPLPLAASRGRECRYDWFVAPVTDPSPISPEGQSGPGSGHTDFDEALGKLKRISKSVRVGKRARSGPVAPVAADSEERMRRLEERLGVVEEVLHALQAKLSP